MRPTSSFVTAAVLDALEGTTDCAIAGIPTTGNDAPKGGALMRRVSSVTAGSLRADVLAVAAALQKDPSIQVSSVNLC